MNYFVKRGEQEFGPYSLAVLQQYVAQGNISQQDLARSEAMTDWAPVSSVLGNVAVPTAATFAAANMALAASAAAQPPKLHWAWVVVLGIVTLGIFWLIWLCVEAAWVRKVRPQSQSLYYVIAYIGTAFGGGFLESFYPSTGVIFRVVATVMGLIAIFRLRSDIEDYYSDITPGFTLSGVMTFFFNAAYFQYHLREQRLLAESAGAAAAGAS